MIENNVAKLLPTKKKPQKSVSPPRSAQDADPDSDRSVSKRQVFPFKTGGNVTDPNDELAVELISPSRGAALGSLEMVNIS